MIEIIFEPISADVEKSVKKTRGRPKLTDEEKKQRLLERKQNSLSGHSLSGHSLSGHSLSGHSLSGHSLSGHSLSGHSLSGHNVCKPKGRPKVLTDEEREQRKVLTEEQKQARNEYLKNYFSKPENKEPHLEYMKKYNIENKEVLSKKRNMYFKNYVNNLVEKEVKKIVSKEVI